MFVVMQLHASLKRLLLAQQRHFGLCTGAAAAAGVAAERPLNGCAAAKLHDAVCVHGAV